MNNSQRIAMARMHLNNGNLLAYKKMMRFNITSAASEKSAQVFQQAWIEDMPRIKQMENQL